MGYSKNNTLHSNTDDWGVVIDGCGNTHEKKYYYNGIWVDLCGLPISEYMKPTYPEGGGGGGGSEKTPNLIKTELKAGIPNYTIKVTSMLPVASKMTVKVTLGNGEVKNLIIPVGKFESQIENTSVSFLEPAPSIENIEHEPKSDNEFNYIVVEPSPLGEGFNTIHNLVKEEDVSDGKIDEKFIKDGEEAFIYKENGGDFSVIIPKLPDGVKPDKKNPVKHSVIICLPKEIYDTKAYKIMEGEMNDVTAEFLPLSNTYVNRMDGLEYVILHIKDEGLKYASKTKDVEIIYKLLNV